MRGFFGGAGVMCFDSRDVVQGNGVVRGGAREAYDGSTA